MNLECWLKGHDYEKVGETFDEDMFDVAYAKIHGTDTIKFGSDILRCKKCSHECRSMNGKRKYNGMMA